MLAACCGADAARLVVHGHSRGGHGAWGLATRIPDRVQGVASLNGWYSREEYGDANNVWIHETSLMYLDKALLGILHASIAENDNNLYASNLGGLLAHVRTSSQDTTVPPWSAWWSAVGERTEPDTHIFQSSFQPDHETLKEPHVFDNRPGR